MAIDPSFSEAILGSFRGMQKDIVDKEITGEDVDQMNAVFGRMEQLANDLSDLNEFNGLMMQENLYMKFSDFYGRALSNASKAQYQVSGDVYDEKSDKQLLDQTLNAYRDAIKRLEVAKKETVERHGEKASTVFMNSAVIIKPIQDVITMGESGITYAVFLRKMIELGMDKAMEGTIMGRDAIIYSKDFYEAAKINPIYEIRENQHLALYDALIAKSKFSVPSILKYNLGCEEINIVLDPQIKKWDAIKNKFEQIFDTLLYWSLAQTSFATVLEPWALAANPRASVLETIECNPGKLQVQLMQFKKYFGLEFNDIFKHEIFIWEVNWQYMWYSQECITYFRDDVFQHCKPGNKLPSELISKIEKIHKEKRFRNPDQIKINERYRDNHNKYFGEGTYEKEFGMPEVYDGGAEKWDLGRF